MLYSEHKFLCTQNSTIVLLVNCQLLVKMLDNPYKLLCSALICILIYVSMCRRHLHNYFWTSIVIMLIGFIFHFSIYVDYYFYCAHYMEMKSEYLHVDSPVGL